MLKALWVELLPQGGLPECKLSPVCEFCFCKKIVSIVPSSGFLIHQDPDQVKMNKINDRVHKLIKTRHRINETGVHSGVILCHFNSHNLISSKCRQLTKIPKRNKQ